MAKEKKAKIEPTLEELQVKKAKRQRGWVRFCAILLAVALTAGMYGVASSGEPNVVSVYPNTVQVSGGTVVKAEEPTTQAAAATPSNSSTPTATTPSTSSDDGGGILDMIMGLLGGIDFSSLISGIDLDGLGITVAGGIQNVKDSLLSLVDKLEAAFTQRTSVTHETVEYPFAAGTDLGSSAERQQLADKLNAATALAAQTNYALNRESDFTEDGHVSVGAQTETLNQILGTAGSGYSLDTLVGGLIGTGTVSADASQPLDESQKNYALKATQLTSDDIRIVSADALTGEYTIALKDVDHPNRQSECGLTKFTNDYLVQSEVADSLKLTIPTTDTNLSTLRLTDLEMKYSNIQISFRIDPLTGRLESLTYSYNAYGKFTVRTNSVQVIGAATTATTATYNNFDYSNLSFAD